MFQHVTAVDAPCWMQRPALRQLVQQEGWGSLWRGLRPRVLFHVPAAAVCWGTYESAKRLLGAEGF